MKRWVAGFALMMTSGWTQEIPPPVVKVTVKLVQVDAVVTDSKGRRVTDLKKEDFEIYQDGVKQKITHLGYEVGNVPAATVAAVRGPKSGAGVAPRPLTAEKTQRTIVLLVDNLGLSFASTAFVRDSLKKFVREQLVPGDLMAVMQTSGGTGAFQQFTNDPRVLNAAIDRIRWSLQARAGASSQLVAGGLDGDVGSVRLRDQRARLGTMATLHYVADGLRRMPGRKAVIVFTDGLMFRPVLNSGVDVSPIEEEILRKMIDAANRAGVVISTVDARGLQTNFMQAADSMGAADVISGGGELTNSRSNEMTRNWDGMIELARTTGGLFYKNNNDIAQMTRAAVDDLNGYYLIGYTPPVDTFRKNGDRPGFHRIGVRVLKPGLRVRSRSGYFGVPDEDVVEARPADPVRQLLRAALSPFETSGIGLRLTALFGNTAEAGSYVSVLMHVAGKDLTFQEEPDGTRKAQVEVASFIYGDDGSVVDQRASAYTIRASKAEYELSLQNGYLYTLQHVMRKPGACQIRAAVRDATSGKAGSASQFLEVPDVAKGGLALSSILLQPEPARRVFRPGVPIVYAFQVYNPMAPDVAVQATVYRDGQPVWTGQPIALAGTKPEDPRRQKVAQQLRFGPSTPTGDYVLQVVATGTAPGSKKPVRVEQSVDFVLATDEHR